MAARDYCAAIIQDLANYFSCHNWRPVMKILGKDEIAKKHLDRTGEIKTQYPGQERQPHVPARSAFSISHQYTGIFTRAYG